MRKKSYTLLLILLIVSSDIVLGKNGNKSKKLKNFKINDNLKDKVNRGRVKRALDEGNINYFWPNEGKINSEDTQYGKSLKTVESDSVVYGKIEKEPPFWATRGRRDSSSSEYDGDVEYTENNHNDHHLRNNLFCKSCFSKSRMSYINPKDIKDKLLVSPFWGNRGKRDSSETDELVASSPFWGNRGRREDNEPFWGNRGRRSKASLFWGNKGRQEEEPFWGNRGRRQDNPFWGSRGRREDEPFWGNRGRRDDSDPFWGTRGRRRESEPFWGSRGRREESEPFWGNRGRRDSKLLGENLAKEKLDLEESILRALNNVEFDVEHLSRLRRSGNIDTDSFWANRGRNSQLKYLFNGTPRSKASFISGQENTAVNGASKLSDAQTVLDSRIYAEEPHYIVVERSSRSSAEDDPYFISRGKKYYFNYGLIKAARDRRGAIEEIVKSVRNDPYYIARGKKNTDIVSQRNSTREEFEKIKDLVCAAINLVMIKTENPQAKREVNENDRDRRTILKKLAAQLQMDPYYVSRGKKYEETGRDEDNLNEFISEMAGKCN